MEPLHCVYVCLIVCVCMCVCVCVGEWVCVCGCAVWSMVCLYILYYECVLITSVRNDHMCAVFLITDRHCGNVSHAFKTGLMLVEFVEKC